MRTCKYCGGVVTLQYSSGSGQCWALVEEDRLGRRWLCQSRIGVDGHELLDLDQVRAELLEMEESLTTGSCSADKST